MKRYFSFPRGKTAIPELDGLRTLAIFLVLGRHAAWLSSSNDTGIVSIGRWDLIIPLLNGWIGVDLFFVLSGFLIAFHLLRHGAESAISDGLRYLGARALRIVPAYFAVLFLVVAGLIPLYSVAPEYLTLRVVYHLLFLQDYFPANIVVAFWSLGVEEKFYLIAPLVVLAAYRAKSRVCRYAFLVGLVLMPSILRATTAVSASEVSDYDVFFAVFRSPFHLTFDGLALGVLCAFIFVDHGNLKEGNAGRWLAVLWYAATSAFFLQLFGFELLGRIGWYQKIFQPLVLSLTFAGLLLPAAFGVAPARALRHHGPLVLARISYPLYLIHVPLIPLTMALSGYQAGSGALAFAGYFAIFTVVSCLAAFALHFAVEKPFLLLKARLWSGEHRGDSARSDQLQARPLSYLPR